MAATKFPGWEPSQDKNLKPSEADGIDRLYDENFLHEITGQSLAGIRRDRQLRRGCPSVKLGALVRYRRSDIVRYLASLSGDGR